MSDWNELAELNRQIEDERNEKSNDSTYHTDALTAFVNTDTTVASTRGTLQLDEEDEVFHCSELQIDSPKDEVEKSVENTTSDSQLHDRELSYEEGQCDTNRTVLETLREVDTSEKNSIVAIVADLVKGVTQTIEKDQMVQKNEPNRQSEDTPNTVCEVLQHVTAMSAVATDTSPPVIGSIDPSNVRDPRLRKRFMEMASLSTPLPPIEEVSQVVHVDYQSVDLEDRDAYDNLQQMTSNDSENMEHQQPKKFTQLVFDGNIRITTFVEFVDKMPDEDFEDDSEDKGVEPPNPSKAINSLDISRNGLIVAASTLDHNFILWNLETKAEAVIPVAKYGANHVTLLPSGDQAITSSTKTNNDLRLLSTHDFSYVRYFKGHTGQVCSLSVSSEGRNILSAAALDKKIFLFDVLQEKHIAVINLDSLPPSFRVHGSDFYGKGWSGLGTPPKPRIIGLPQPVVSFDPGNVVFGIMCRSNDEILKLYDMRNYTNGPFLTVKHDWTESLLNAFPKDSEDHTLKMSMMTAIGSEFNDMKFSPDGSYILINTNGPLFYVLDAVSGNLINIFGRKHREYDNTFSYPNYSPGISNLPEVSFSHDSHYLLGGNGDLNDPRIYVWSVETGEEVGIINKSCPKVTGRYSNHPHFGICYLKVNPVYQSIVVGGGRRISVYSPKFDAVSHAMKSSSRGRRLSAGSDNLHLFD
jgi:COMPASS component SWD2